MSTKRRPRGKLRPATLKWLALRCWDWAGDVEEPTLLPLGTEQRLIGVEEHAHAVLERAVEANRSVPIDRAEQEAQWADRHSARHVLEVLKRDGRINGLFAKGDHQRHWAIWKMMNVLLERSVYDPANRCVADCKHPRGSRGYCPRKEAGTGRGRCAASLVFFYKTKNAAATAVRDGFIQAGKLSAFATVASVTRHFDRHFDNR